MAQPDPLPVKTIVVKLYVQAQNLGGGYMGVKMVCHPYSYS